MRRYRLLVSIAVLIVSIRCGPSLWCGREAGRLWNDDPELQSRLAASADHWRSTRLTEGRFMTDSPRFDGEWLFGTYMMASLGYLQLAQADVEQRDEHLAAADECIARILDKDVRRFDRAAWSTDPLDDLGTDRAHAAYLGYLNLVLSLRRGLSDDSPTAALNDRISSHLSRHMARSPHGVIATYPSEVYPVDNAAVVASLTLHQQFTDADHRGAIGRWDDNFESFRDPDTGLLFQSVRYRDGRPTDSPRGSGTGLAAYFLSFSDPEQSQALYYATSDELRRSTLGFSAMREYPAGEQGRGDIDSGPVILGLSISSTGFALASSRAHGDRDTFESLWATTYLFGAPVDRGDARFFAFGGPLGDAMMFALLTTRPAGEWSTLS